MILCIEVNDFLKMIPPNLLFHLYHEGEFFVYTAESIPDRYKHLDATVKKLEIGYLIAIHKHQFNFD